VLCVWLTRHHLGPMGPVLLMDRTGMAGQSRAKRREHRATTVNLLSDDILVLINFFWPIYDFYLLNRQ
jgi:hypothetical protein